MGKHKGINFLIFSFFIGIFSVLFLYYGLWDRLLVGLSTVKWYMWFVYFLIAFYVTLTIHELGHFIAFRVQGIKLRAIYLTIFVFYKKKNRWRFTIKPKLWVLLGGLVVPDLELIEDAKSYYDVSKKFAIALIAAPIVTISFMGLSFMSEFLFLIFTQSDGLVGIMTVFNLFVIILSLLYMYTFRLSTQNIFGDYVAYKKIKDDEVFRFTQINQYMSFRSDQDHLFSIFMWEKSKELLKAHKMRHNMIYTMLLTTYIEGVLYENQGTDEEVDQIIVKLPLTFYIKSEHGLTLAYDICLYHYKTGRVEKAYELLEMIGQKASKKIDAKVKHYLDKKARHVMNITYDPIFLNHKKNYPYGDMWIFEPIIDIYKDIDKLHEPLPFIAYEVKVDLKED